MERVNTTFLLPRVDQEESPKTGSLSVQVITKIVFFELIDTKNKKVVRSLGSWHLPNLETPDTSLYDAYLYFIETAQHFIYIGKFYWGFKSPNFSRKSIFYFFNSWRTCTK